MEGEVSPSLQPAKPSSATPSPRGSAPKTPKYTFIDLFAGCGGLSEGFLQSQKYKALAHVEWETPMVNTLRKRLIEKWGHSEDEALKRVIKFDIQKTDELLLGSWSEESKKLYAKENHKSIVDKGLKGLIGNETVDLIIGGPPCQAYSIAGRAQSPNGMKDDYRNFLFESFVKVVDFFKPKLFVFENVPGLLTASPGDIPVRIRIFESFKKIGYEIRNPENLKNSIYCAKDFDVPQKRNRIIIFGTRKDSNCDVEELYQNLTVLKNSQNPKTVHDTIRNLPPLYPLPIKDIKKVGKSHVSHYQTSDKKIANHEPRFHGERDQRLFREWLTNNMNTFSQEEKKAFYTKITGHTSNHIKYRNLEWDKPSPTIVAHLYKDGYMFIHPDVNQLRTITVREAALLQTFPSDYSFPSSSSYNYKMIGNAVPVLFAKAIALAVYNTLSQKEALK